MILLKPNFDSLALEIRKLYRSATGFHSYRVFFKFSLSFFKNFHKNLPSDIKTEVISKTDLKTLTTSSAYKTKISLHIQKKILCCVFNYEINCHEFNQKMSKTALNRRKKQLLLDNSFLSNEDLLNIIYIIYS